MEHSKQLNRFIRKAPWLLALLPVGLGITELHAQILPTQARRWELELQARRRRRPPPQGGVIFNDQSPRVSGHDLSGSTYVGYQVCAGCHGRLTSTRPEHTVIEEWEAPTNLHANDGAALAGGRINVYEREVTDGIPVDGAKKCGTCHTTGAPEIRQPQVSQRNGWDPSEPWNGHNHNSRFLRVQCENCHGPGSQHVRSGGDTRLINRVPDPKQTCWRCHTNTPNEKGNPLVTPATDALIALYSSSLTRSHNAGVMITGSGGYEYAGETYTEGRSHPHTKIATTCVTCHTAKPRRSPILDHSSLKAKIGACQSCHLDARNVADIEHWDYVETRQHTVRELLIRLGGATAEGEPDANARGGLLGNAANTSSPEYKRARWNYSLVLNDGSLGVHNFDYAVKLLLTSIAHAPAQRPAGARGGAVR